MHPQSTIHTCEFCQKSYPVGFGSKGRFCSLACANAQQKANQPVGVCPHCEKHFGYSPSLKRRFCSLVCWYASDDFIALLKRPRVAQKIQPATVNTYRRYRRDFCEQCGKRNVRMVAHHIDHDRNNNAPENIQTLCDSCHNAHHRRPVVVQISDTNGNLIEAKPCTACAVMTPLSDFYHLKQPCKECVKTRQRMRNRGVKHPSLRR